MLLEDADYFVRLVPFPPGKIDGCVTPNDDGTFSVYIDANADDAHRRAALNHELNHIRMDHLYSDKPPDVIEREADTGIEIPAPKEEEGPERWPDYFESWRRCIEWASAMQSLYGDNPPPVDYQDFVRQQEGKTSRQAKGCG